MIDIQKVDKFRLDEEWEEQPKLYLDHSDQLATAQHTLDVYEADLELVMAELDRDIRREPDKFGIEKITETVVKNAVILSKQYQSANRKVIEARFRVNQLKGVLTGLDHRKKALEGLVYLHSAGYYADHIKPPKGRESIVGEMKADRALGKKRTN